MLFSLALDSLESDMERQGKAQENEELAPGGVDSIPLLPMEEG